MSKAWIEQEHAFGNVSPFLQFQPSVHFPAFQVCIGRSIGCQSPHQTLACTLLLISDVTRLQVVEYIHICTFQNTYLQLQTLSLLFHVTVTSPLAMPPPCHGPQTHNVPGQPQYHTVSKLETHIFVIITHLGAQVDSWVCRGRHFDERETAALVLVVSRTWGGGRSSRVRTYALHHHSFLFQADPIDKKGFSQIRSFDKHCTEYICTSLGLRTIPFQLLLCFSK